MYSFSSSIPSIRIYIEELELGVQMTSLYWSKVSNTSSCLLEALFTKFRDLKVPPEVMSIDETMVPFRGRLPFLQYILGKSQNTE